MSTLADKAFGKRTRPPESPFDFDLDLSLELPSGGTAPFNEIEAFHSPDNGQRHDSEACTPSENVPDVSRRSKEPNSCPAGFRWGQDSDGNPQLKPIASAVDALASLVAHHYDDSEMRRLVLKEDPKLLKSLKQFLICIKGTKSAGFLASITSGLEDNPDCMHIERQLDQAKACIDRIDDRVGDAFIRAIGKQAEVEFAQSSYWMNVHKDTVLRHSEQGNERAAENALIRAEEARMQVLMAAQILDHCVKLGFKFDAQRAARAGLRLRGWQLTRRVLDNNKYQSKAAREREEQREAFREGFNF